MIRHSAIVLVAALGGLAAFAAGPVRANPATKPFRDAADFVLKKFGRKAVQEGTETLARKLEVAAAAHGTDIIRAVQLVGPRALPLCEAAGKHGAQAARVLARHGEGGVTWVLARPKAMQLFLKHGDDAAIALVRHAGVAEKVIEHAGAPAIKALQAVNGQSGRRMAMLMEGELAQVVQKKELLEVIARFGDRACDFAWRHKCVLATGAVLTAFVANPEPYLEGAKDLAEIGRNVAKDVVQIAAETAIKPLAQAPAAVATEMARRTNWTVVILVVIVMIGVILLLVARRLARRRAEGAR